ncbi:MAG: type II and III secretion system protein [Synergistaceae bacterium]|nr:type II and III secretion system protein [Synergistaceae bacterium]
MLGFAVQFGLAFPAEAAARRDIPPGLTMESPAKIKPVIAGIQVSQIGGTMLRVRVRGFDLPIPRAASAPGAAKLVLQWDGARFPQSVDKADWWGDYDWDILNFANSSTNSWWKQYDLPLLNRINAEPIDEDSLRLTFVTSQPVVIEKIDGIAGADELLIVLKIFEPEKAPAPAEKPRQYQKGDPMGIKAPVTLQLRDADIKDVFRMLADMQKLNLMFGSSVPSMPVTFSFNGVPYNEAFSYLLRAADLSYEVKNGMLVVDKPESLPVTLGTEVVRAYKLSYAVDEGGQVRTDIIGSLTGLISLSKTPTLDARNRELYVTASEAQHKEIAALLERLDHPGRQVMLEARIFEVADNGTQDLESLVAAVYDHWIASFTSSGLNMGYNYSSRGWEVGDDWSLPIGGSVGGSPVWENPMIGGTERALTAGLRALETKGKGKNLANPSVITIDGQQATVSLTQNVKYASGVDSNGNVTFSEVQSGPRLNFLPVVGRDGVVTIKIAIETGEILGWRAAGMGAQAPETSSRRVETTVRVRNGEPFVVGGLFQDNKTISRNRIPVLGSIPLLGELFTFRHDEHRKTEVAMIVIPYILDVPTNAIDTFDLKKTSNLP